MKLFLRLIGYVRPHWRRLTAALVCMAVFALLSGVSLGMILPFVNVLFEDEGLVSSGGTALVADAGADGTATTGAPEDRSDTVAGVKEDLREYLLSFFRSESPQRALVKICFALLIVFFVKSLFGYLQRFLMITVEQGVIRDLRDSLFSRLSELSLSYFHGRRTGQLISRITNDVTLVRGALVATFASLFRETLLTVIYIGVAFWISWRLTLITFVVLPPIVFMIVHIGQRLRKRSARIQQKMADVSSTLEETITGIRVVKAFGMEGYERERFFGHTLGYCRTYIRMESLGALAGPLTEYLGVIGVVFVLWYGGRQVLIAGVMSPDWFIIFLAAILSTMQPLRNLSKANNQLQVGLAAVQRIVDVLDAEPAVPVRPGAIEVSDFGTAIRYEDVRFSYDTGEEVLRGIDLEVRSGEVVAVVGPSGAGKSTLLDLLPRFYDPTGGRVTVDGIDIRDLDLGSLRGLLGIVTQETILFNDSVGRNIAYGRAGAGATEIEAAALAANAHGFVSAMPEGYDTMIGERGSMLSGGERQRLAIARAILKDPPILIFDEATSSLDTESERLVQEAIERLFRGRTVLIIAHRLSTVRNADRIVVLDGGVIRESGTHEELMELNGAYRRLYELQFRDGPADKGRER